MRRILISLALVSATLAPAHAEQVVHGAGWAEASFSLTEHVSVAFERDFSGTYGWGTYVYGDTVLALAFDCITFEAGAGIGEGVLVASGVAVGGVPFPLLRGITIKIDARSSSVGVGAVENLHVQTGDCGADKVSVRPGLTASMGYVPLPA